MTTNRWPFILGFLITGITAVSLHVLIIFNCPAPTVHINFSINNLLHCVIRLFTISGALMIALLSYDYWQRFILLWRIIFFMVLNLALTEQLLREPLMQIITGYAWSKQCIDSLAVYLGYLSFSTLIFFNIPILQAYRYKCLTYSILVLIATSVDMAIRGAVHTFLAPTTLAIQQDASMPYGFTILVPAYITFLEPTLAVFVLYNLLKKPLVRRTTLTKVLIVWAMLFLLHAGIYAIIQMCYSDGDIFYRIFYYGHFLWEYLALSFGSVYCSDLWLHTLPKKEF